MHGTKLSVVYQALLFNVFLKILVSLSPNDPLIAQKKLKG